ncbi:MAG: winged helix-turn-helix domain-containing protein [Elusimicrobia bacterium]|nr:winged helix-turn-helix domain-containing protein [Elusimicrobiota bacterium]
MDKKLSFTEAAYEILKNTNEALSSVELVDIALAKKLIKTKGKTPEATMWSVLYLEGQRKGNKARFVQVGKDKWALSEWGKETIQVEIEKYNKETQEIQLKIQKTIVGDPLNFEGLQYAPINEQGVVFLFGKLHKELGIIVEAIQTGYPDAKGRKKVKQGWQEIAIEFEYRSSNFQSHKHPIDKCDLIICWIHDWKECPIEVVELKSVVENKLNNENK